MAAGHEPSDTLHAALQLQREASLMSSNLTVLHQYVITLHRMSTKVLHSCVQPGVLPFGSGQRCCAVAPCVLGIYGPFATPGLSGWSQFGLCTPGPRLPGLCLMSSVAFRLVVSRSSRTALLHRFMLDLVVG